MLFRSEAYCPVGHVHGAHVQAAHAVLYPCAFSTQSSPAPMRYSPLGHVFSGSQLMHVPVTPSFGLTHVVPLQLPFGMHASELSARRHVHVGANDGADATRRNVVAQTRTAKTGAHVCALVCRMFFSFE